MPINTMLLKQIRTNDPALTSLSRVGYRIDAEGANALADALKANTTLTSLDLEQNQIGVEGAKALAEALMTSTSLVSLNLRFNHISVEGAKALANALKVNTSLTSLNLVYNHTGVEGAKALANALKVNISLTSLYLNGNKIGRKGANALADALKVNTTLMNLDLGDNTIGTKGVKALANALKVNTSLTRLNLPLNNIGDEGAKALADALKVNATLTNLVLLYNKIGDEGAKALADALKANPTLTNLDLSYNQIGVEGARVLMDALKDNITLTSIDLRNSLFDDVLPEIDFYTSKRNINISFLLKDCIKVAWVKPVARYSLEDYQSALSKMNSIFPNVNHVNVRESYEKLIESIYELRLSDNMSEVELTEAVLERLKAYISSLSLNLETLSDTAYASEFARLLSARVNMKNVGDPEAQVMALAALAQPFHDEDFREEAKPELIGLLNNRYFSNLSEGSVQRRALDLLTLDLACQHPRERDLMGFALAAYSRLSGGGKITFDQVMNKLNENEAVVADFEKLLTEECESKAWSREVLREKCFEVITQEFVPAPPRSTSPNPHGLFQPFVASASPVAEVKAPQNK